MRSRGGEAKTHCHVDGIDDGRHEDSKTEYSYVSISSKSLSGEDGRSVSAGLVTGCTVVSELSGVGELTTARIKSYGEIR
ncbi:hypothetical protein Tco_0093288 [Tanacetum coccineum]